MSFADPIWLYAIPVVLVVFGLLIWRTEHVRRTRLRTLAAQSLWSQLANSTSRWRRILRYALVGLGLIFLLTALARPQWGFYLEEVEGRGIDILFAVDVSRSMLAEDVAPSRLERAKLAILDLVDSLEGERTGLVAFAGSAFLNCPLTLDRDAFRLSLGELKPGLLPRAGTDVAAAIAEAMASFPESEGEKFLVLISDGEDLAAAGVEQARLAAEQGMIIFTVGVGSPEGELIPVTDRQGRRSFLRDNEGNVVQTALDETTLRAIAEATGGFYSRLTGISPLNRVYQAGRERLPETDRQEGVREIPINRFVWPLGLALLCFLLEPLIGTRRLQRRVIVSPTTGGNLSKAAGFGLVGLIVWGTPDEASADAREAVRQYRENNFEAAAEAFEEAREEDPEDSRLPYNLGNSLYQQNRFEEASEAYTSALAAEELALQEQAFFNLGNAQFQHGAQLLQEQEFQEALGTWEAAETSFETALELNPENEDALRNRDLVRSRIEALRAYIEQLPENPNQQQQEGGENQEQQDQDESESSEQSQQNQEGEQPESGDQNQENEQQQEDGSQNNENAGSEEQQQQEQQSGDGAEEDSPEGDLEMAEPQEALTEGEEEQSDGDAQPIVRMTEEEATMLLEALRSEERKLPAGQLYRFEEAPESNRSSGNW